MHVFVLVKEIVEAAFAYRSDFLGTRPLACRPHPRAAPCIQIGIKLLGQLFYTKPSAIIKARAKMGRIKRLIWPARNSVPQLNAFHQVGRRVSGINNYCGYLKLALVAMRRAPQPRRYLMNGVSIGYGLCDRPER